MRRDILKYIEDHDLCKKKDRILLTVSGGIDSVAMLDLMVKTGFSCGIAHCNFQLRGKESEGDEEFVLALGKKYNIETFHIRFETKLYASENNISTQMAARDLRYSWFREIAEQNGYQYIAIAHNADDNVETFHLNLARGTGLSGIRGMDAKAGNIIRPLLFASRKEITEYIEKNKLDYREDSSNREVNYKRNYLRHEIIPRMSELNPAYPQTILQNMEFLRQSSLVLDDLYENILPHIVDKSGESIKIRIKELLDLKGPAWFLHKYLTQFGFTSRQIINITAALNAEPGKQFFSETHLLLKDRENLILTINDDIEGAEYQIDSERGLIKFPFDIGWEILYAPAYAISKNSRVASLDAGKISFPLILRKWKDGDSFKPLGMTGFKKISDFLIDNKISLLDKNNTWVLCSGDDIVWVVGMRIDERFKVTEETESVLKVILL